MNVHLSMPSKRYICCYNQQRRILCFLLWLVVILHPARAVPFPTQGPIEDAKCNVEDLEQANDSQLYTILHDITKTAFFRNFIVDLNHKCPLQAWSSGETSSEDDDEFECPGGSAIEELVEPLCSVQSNSENPFEFESNALKSISQAGFQSKSQKETFSWKQHSDVVVVSEDKDCESPLPDSFWMDMCSNIQAGSPNVVNLQLNPERNTGYNGTHIWKAIYEENCIDQSQDMCLEERVLYRLLSGLHTSTTVSIAVNYHPPSKRKGRTTWEPNPQYFMDKFQLHPEYIQNLHFSYVVLLRALRKATPFLYTYEIRTGDIVQDETATVLLKRLLDSAILGSCGPVFEAFDESIMFQEGTADAVVSLQQNFKGVFHNVSSILDCVQCQQCKLHGKLAMMGYGAALKVLFMRNSVSLERNEVVALINTLAKFSESIRHVRELTKLYWERHQAKETLRKGAALLDSDSLSSLEVVDRAVELAAELGRKGRIPMEQEANLVKLALARKPELLILAKHYSDSPEKFLYFVSQTIEVEANTNDEPDAIIVGSGLAGLAAALNILDRGGRVVLIEKEHLLGGNSNKASSGINACCLDDSRGDELELFRNDTLRSAGEAARPDLIDILVSRSAAAVSWLKDRVGVDLSLVAQLGGHSSKRTHRPANGMVGAEIIYGMQKAVKSYQKTGKVDILLDTKVTSLLTDSGGRVVGVRVSTKDNDDGSREIRASNVVLATGGFAADRSAGSFLEKYRPELLKLPTTAGAFSTGDGIALATSLGAATVDMDKVQVHPTGWIDPSEPNSTTKILAAELMRGVGGILLNTEGSRFCNELGNRAYVTDKMLSHNAQYAKTGKWDPSADIPIFFMVLSSSAAEDAKKHVDLYTHKGLLTRVQGINGLATYTGLPQSKLIETLQKYQQEASEGEDEFGKTAFRGVPESDLESEIFYIGRTTPVLHYCMGGITIDREGNVLTNDGRIIPGLHAAGEVTGGVHGGNRLGGNSLLECTVFGTIVGQKIPIQAYHHEQVDEAVKRTDGLDRELRIISLAELREHNTPDDCWVALHGTVYDLTAFAEEHPAGAQSVYGLAGKDGTEAFSAVHSQGIMDDFTDERLGLLGT